MTEANYSIDRDLAEAKSMADHLEPYVYGDQLYGNIGGMFSTSATPSLTIGAFLMRLHRLRALEGQLSAAQKATLSEIEASNEHAQKEWGVHYNEKMINEANSRLKMIETFFGDCQEDPRSCATNYMPEALRRTIVQDIANEVERLNLPSDDLDKNLRRIDSQLHRFTEKSDFIWGAELQSAYPSNAYWWLYARPPRV